MEDDNDGASSTDASVMAEEPAERLLARYLDTLDEHVSVHDCATISRLLRRARRPVAWCENPKLYYLLDKVGKSNLFSELLKQGITDLWIPFSKKTVGSVLGKSEVKNFIKYQKACLDDDYLDNEHPLQVPGRHLSLDDGDSLALVECGKLGSGGMAEVHRVKYTPTGAVYARKTMQRLNRPESHLELMENFKRELDGMRRAKHRHCVDLVMSYTEADSVSMLLIPVADMDLAQFLNKCLNPLQKSTLRHAVGCITSALVYLHSEKIRHDDVKTNNVLVYKSTVLLTDFGFCRVTPNKSASTTRGPAQHSVPRYSAPEVFADPSGERSSLTDVWGLGCVLLEILSYLRGHKLQDMEAFWKAQGNCANSFALNAKATHAWCDMLVADQGRTQHGSHRRELLLVSYVRETLLELSRTLRPTALQVLDKLKDMDFIYPVSTADSWVNSCCVRQSTYTPDVSKNANFRISSAEPERDPYFAHHLPHWPSLDLGGLDNNLAYLLLDLDLKVLAHSDNLTYLAPTAPDIRQLFLTDGDINQLREDIDVMLRSLNISKHTAKTTPLDWNDFKLMSKSLHIVRFEQTASVVRHLCLSQPKQPLPRCYTTQLMLTTVPLSRQSASGAPFLVLTFDPAEGELVGYSYTEGHMGLWTDGLIDSDYTQTECAQRHAHWREVIGRRKKHYRETANRLTIIRKGFEEAKCVRCKLYRYECSGPPDGPCYKCHAAKENCLYDRMDIESGGSYRLFIESDETIDAMATVRWAS